MQHSPTDSDGSDYPEELVQYVDSRYGRIGRFTHDTSAVGRSLTLYGEWAGNEIAFLNRFIPAGGTVIDIGAYIGTHSMAFARAVGPSGRVLAFEAQPNTFQLLARNLDVNALRWVEAVNAVVSDSPGRLEIPAIDIDHDGRFGSASLRHLVAPDEGPSADGTGQRAGVASSVQSVAIDTFELERCDLIKLDIEGMEYIALRGCERTIARLSPTIYAECNSVADALRTFEALKAVGYHVRMHVVAAFNPNNFHGNMENIFGIASEAALLAVPLESAERLDSFNLQPNEILAVMETADDIVLGLLNKPQYPVEILAHTRAAASGAKAWLERFGDLQGAMNNRADVAQQQATAAFKQRDDALALADAAMRQAGAARAIIEARDREIAELRAVITSAQQDPGQAVSSDTPGSTPGSRLPAVFRKAKPVAHVPEEG